VDDDEAVAGCQRLLRAEGILAGGSSGSVVAALERLVARLPGPARICTLLPDRGERYLDLVYGAGADEPVAALSDLATLPRP
jgi:cysteine synthase A